MTRSGFIQSLLAMVLGLLGLRVPEAGVSVPVALVEGRFGAGDLIEGPDSYGQYRLLYPPPDNTIPDWCLEGIVTTSNTTTATITVGGSTTTTTYLGNNGSL